MVCAAAAWSRLRRSAAPGPDPRIAQAPSAGGLDADADLDAMFLAARLLTSGIDEEIALIQAEAATLGLGLADRSRPVGRTPSGPENLCDASGNAAGSWLIAAATGGMVAVGMMVLSGLAQAGRGEATGKPGRGRVERPRADADRGPMNAR